MKHPVGKLERFVEEQILLLPSEQVYEWMMQKAPQRHSIWAVRGVASWTPEMRSAVAAAARRWLLQSQKSFKNTISQASVNSYPFCVSLVANAALIVLKRCSSVLWKERCSSVAEAFALDLSISRVSPIPPPPLAARDGMLISRLLLHWHESHGHGKRMEWADADRADGFKVESSISLLFEAENARLIEEVLGTTEDSRRALEMLVAKKEDLLRISSGFISSNAAKNSTPKSIVRLASRRRMIELIASVVDEALDTTMRYEARRGWP